MPSSKESQSNNKNNDLFRHILQNKKPELVIVALLLTGKLRFDSIQLYREAAVEVTLVGAFNNPDTEPIDQIVDFLEENSDMTLDDLLTE